MPLDEIAEIGCRARADAIRTLARARRRSVRLAPARSGGGRAALSPCPHRRLDRPVPRHARPRLAATLSRPRISVVLKALGVTTARAAEARAASFRPWRAYAVMHLLAGSFRRRIGCMNPTPPSFEATPTLDRNPPRTNRLVASPRKKRSSPKWPDARGAPRSCESRGRSHPAPRLRRPPDRGVFRRRASRLRSPAGGCEGSEVSTHGVWRALTAVFRRRRSDARSSGAAAVENARWPGAGRRHPSRAQPHQHHRALSPRDRWRRRAHGLWRGLEAKQWLSRDAGSACPAGRYRASRPIPSEPSSRCASTLAR